MFFIDLMNCKEYDVKSGYKYTDFFEIDTFRQKNGSAAENGILLNLKLFVITGKDAHILLSPTQHIKASAVYEIGLYNS